MNKLEVLDSNEISNVTKNLKKASECASAILQIGKNVDAK